MSIRSDVGLSVRSSMYAYDTENATLLKKSLVVNNDSNKGVFVIAFLQGFIHPF